MYTTKETSVPVRLETSVVQLLRAAKGKACEAPVGKYHEAELPSHLLGVATSLSKQQS